MEVLALCCELDCPSRDGEGIRSSSSPSSELGITWVSSIGSSTLSFPFKASWIGEARGLRGDSGSVSDEGAISSSGMLGSCGKLALAGGGGDGDSGCVWDESGGSMSRRPSENSEEGGEGPSMRGGVGLGPGDENTVFTVVWEGNGTSGFKPGEA